MLVRPPPDVLIRSGQATRWTLISLGSTYIVYMGWWPVQLVPDASLNQQLHHWVVSTDEEDV